jgi:hypothetical protein
MLSQTDFMKAKEAAIASEPLTKPVKLSDITLSETSQKDGFITLGGSRVPANGNFFKQLASLLNINTTLSNKFSKNGDDGIGNKLMSAVKNYTQSRVGDMDLMLVADKSKQSVTGVAKADKYSRISNETLFATADQILNSVPNMHIESIDNGGGSSRINLIHTDEVGFERLGKDEVFRFGVSLVNTPTQTGIEDFFYRLVCANGAVAKDMTAAFQLKDLTPQAITELFDKLKAYGKTGFVPKSFSEKLERATGTRASLLEMERAIHQVTGNLKAEDPEMRKRLEQGLIDTHFHSYKPTVARVFSKGFSTDAMTDKQKSFIKTGQSVWDIVNELTWLGSHNTIEEFENRARFKAAGGALFAKANFDLEAAQFATI